jgi:hypothetical protein
VSQSALRRLRFVAHGADLFADPGAGYVYPAFEGLEVNCTRKPRERKFQSSDHDHFAPAMGEKECDLKLAMEMRGFGGATPGAGNGVAATEGESGLLLKSCFGTQVLQTGGAVATGTTTTVVHSTANFAVGTFLGIVDPATGLFHVRQIRAKAGGPTYQYTLDRALPIDPADASVLYASATYYHATSGHQHLFFDAEGYDATPAKGWRYSLFGCLGTVGFKNLSAAGKAMLEFAFKGLDWSDANKGTNQPAPSYPANLPSAGAFIRNSRLWVGASQLVVSEVGFEPGAEIQAKPSTAAVNGVAGYQVVGKADKLTFKVSEEDAEALGTPLSDSWDAGAALDILVELTQGGPGNSFAIAAPKAQIIEYKPSSLNGLDYRDVTLQILGSGITGCPASALGVL